MVQRSTDIIRERSLVDTVNDLPKARHGEPDDDGNNVAYGDDQDRSRASSPSQTMTDRIRHSDASVNAYQGDEDDADVGESVVHEGKRITENHPEWLSSQKDDHSEEWHVNHCYQEVSNRQTQYEIVVVSTQFRNRNKYNDH